MATHSSIPAWRISWTEEPGGDSPSGRKGSDMTEWLTFSLFTFNSDWMTTDLKHLKLNSLTYLRSWCILSSLGSHLILIKRSYDGDSLRRKAGPSSRISVKTICFVNLMWTLQMCGGAEATSFYRLAISWVNMAPLPWPSKETLQRKKPRSSSDGGNSEVALALNSEGLGVNTNWFDLTVCEHLCGGRGWDSLSLYMCCWWSSFKLYFKWKGLWNSTIWESFPQMGLSKWTYVFIDSDHVFSEDHILNKRSQG